MTALLVVAVILGLIFGLLTLMYRSLRMFVSPNVLHAPLAESSAFDSERLSAFVAELGLEVRAVAHVYWSDTYIEEAVWLAGTGHTWAEINGRTLSWMSRGSGQRWMTRSTSKRLASAAALARRVVPWPATWRCVAVAGDLQRARQLHDEAFVNPSPAPANVEEWLADVADRVQENVQQRLSSGTWKVGRDGMQRPVRTMAVRMALLAPVQIMITHSANLPRALWGGREARPVVF